MYDIRGKGKDNFIITQISFSFSVKAASKRQKILNNTDCTIAQSVLFVVIYNKYRYSILQIYMLLLLRG